MSVEILNPFDHYQTLAGAPIDMGKLYIGVANLDPQTNPIAVFYDEALTIAAPQPLTTSAGYVWRSGAPARIFTASPVFSIKLLDKNNVQVFYSAESGGVGGDYTAPFTGAVSRTQASKNAETLSLGDFLSSGATVYSAAQVQAVIDQVAAAKKRLISIGDYHINGSINITCACDFSQSDFYIYGAPAVAIIVGSDVSGVLITDLDFVLPRNVINTTKPAMGWVDQGIGVRVKNVYSCRVWTNKISQFAINLQCGGLSTGFSYNEVYIGHLFNGQINCDLGGLDAGGWCNENTFYGGRYSHLNAEGSNVVGTRHIRINKPLGTFQPNNNVFVKPSLEGDTSEYVVENGGAYNHILHARWEGAARKVLYTADNANHGTQNTIIGGYKAENLEFVYVGTSAFKNMMQTVDKTTVRGSSASALASYKNVGSNNYSVFNLYAATNTAVIENDDGSAANMRIGATFTEGKATGDAFMRIKVDYELGRIYMGDGTASPTDYMRLLPSAGFLFTKGLFPATTNTYRLGSTTQSWQSAAFTQGIGFHGATPPSAKPVVSGSRGGNAALTSLLTALNACGLIDNQTTA